MIQIQRQTNRDGEQRDQNQSQKTYSDREILNTIREQPEGQKELDTTEIDEQLPNFTTRALQMRLNSLEEEGRLVCVHDTQPAVWGLAEDEVDEPITSPQDEQAHQYSKVSRSVAKWMSGIAGIGVAIPGLILDFDIVMNLAGIEFRATSTQVGLQIMSAGITLFLVATLYAVGSYLLAKVIPHLWGWRSTVVEDGKDRGEF